METRRQIKGERREAKGERIKKKKKVMVQNLPKKVDIS